MRSKDIPLRNTIWECRITIQGVPQDCKVGEWSWFYVRHSQIYESKSGRAVIYELGVMYENGHGVHLKRKLSVERGAMGILLRNTIWE